MNLYDEQVLDTNAGDPANCWHNQITWEMC